MNTQVNTQTKNKNENEIGALWKKTGKAGTFLSGKLDLSKVKDKEVRIVIFSNDRKSNDAAPDYRVYISNALPAASAQQPATQQQKSYQTKQQQPPVKQQSQQDDLDGDLI